ncbi:MAG: hypothetical protein JEZ07_16270 [Phycisphaerae bacterium]|nr:hypothetical protein [Phycisphaerae bacterium]
MTISIIITITFSFAIFMFTMHFTKELSNIKRLIATAIAVTSISIFGFYFFDSALILNLLPFTDTIIYGNLAIPIASIIAALLFQSKKIPTWRQIILIICIITFACRPTFKVLTASIPITTNTINNKVHIQSHRSTCGPTAAATLLSHHGINATETELVPLCLTTTDGTFIHGLYRGLKIKTKNTNLKVKAGICTLDELKTKIPLPAIIPVRLTESVNDREPRYANQWHWQLNVTHTIVVYSFQNNKVQIADPAVGKEQWDIKSLQDLWHGTYITIK